MIKIQLYESKNSRAENKNEQTKTKTLKRQNDEVGET